MNFWMFKLDLEKAVEPEIKLLTSVGSSKKQESSIKNLLLLYWQCQSLWLCGSQQTVDKASGGDGISVELLQILKDDAVKVLHSICQQIWKTQQWPQGWKRSVFIPTPKKGNSKEFSNYRTVALIWHTSKVMLKILQARLQEYVNHELPDVQAGFRKGRGTRDQIANISWVIEKAREFQKKKRFIGPWKHLDFWLQLQELWGNKFVILSHSVCGTWLQ